MSQVLIGVKFLVLMIVLSIDYLPPSQFMACRPSPQPMTGVMKWTVATAMIAGGFVLPMSNIN